jgi:hypothetical protein
VCGLGLGQLVAAGVAEQPILVLVGRGGLAQDLGDLGPELVVGAVGLVRGVGGQLGPVEGDGADADHAGGGTQPQGLDEEAGERLLVADTEARDSHVVRRLVAGKDPEGEVLCAAAFELPGGAHPQAVAIEEHAEQGLGVVGGVAVPIARSGSCGASGA